MCESFKLDFVKKTVEALDSNVTNKLKEHYGLVIKPCVFENVALSKCKKLFIAWGRKDDFGQVDMQMIENNVLLGGRQESGFICKSCKSYVCSWCRTYKMAHNKCINCYLPDNQNNLQLIPKSQRFLCNICDEKDEIYRLKTHDPWETCVYCKNCNSLNCLIFILDPTIIEKYY